jgi:hypothetical protein
LLFGHSFNPFCRAGPNEGLDRRSLSGAAEKLSALKRVVKRPQKR